MSSSFLLYSRSDGIRTHDLCVPNAALYQTEPRFANAKIIILVFYSFVNKFFQVFYFFVFFEYFLMNYIYITESMSMEVFSCPDIGVLLHMYMNI